MVRTDSTMIELGTQAPDFTLEDHNPRTDAGACSLKDVQGDKGTLVMFLCQHCPYVKHLELELAEAANGYQERGIGAIAIQSNDIENYPQDGPEGMAEQAERCRFDFPYVLDGTQEVAQAYHAACTPDIFLFDGELKLVYRGQFDGTRPGSGQPTGEDLDAAVEALLSGEVLQDQAPSQGCNIKWKPGNEPGYFG